MTDDLTATFALAAEDLGPADVALLVEHLSIVEQGLAHEGRPASAKMVSLAAALLTLSPPPQPGAVTTAVQELRELTACRCNEAWTGRGLHDPSCASEYREDVETIAAALPQPGAVTLPASVVRALLPESQDEHYGGCQGECQAFAGHCRPTPSEADRD